MDSFETQILRGDEARHSRESVVVSYARDFPIVIKKALGSIISDAQDNRYIDFFSGAGALNYGHNNPDLKKSMLKYLSDDGIVHGLDMCTEAKLNFIDTFTSNILDNRQMDYKIQFCGPTGTNAVEAALKLAWKVTGRKRVLAFQNSFHGMTLGSLAVTHINFYKKHFVGTHNNFVDFLPFCSDSNHRDTHISLLNDYFCGAATENSLPAAVIIECIQGEGGINVADTDWLKKLASLCQDYEVLLIVDDIQMGCGRTGSFFSFETMGIQPDIVALSKSISGYGLPMAINLIKPKFDCWEPGEHNGTFRGNNLAFVTAAAAIDRYWSDATFKKEIAEKSEVVLLCLQELCDRFQNLGLTYNGKGLVYGLKSTKYPNIMRRVREICFSKKLIVETCGTSSQVLKLMPALTIDEAILRQGLATIVDSMAQAVEEINV